MTDVVQLVVAAAVAASTYALIGLAWNLVFTTCGYLNLAVGEFFVLSGVLAAKLPTWTGIRTPWVIVPMVILAIAALAGVVERTLVRPLPDRDLGPLIVLIGVALVIALVVDALAPEVAVRSEDFVAGPPWSMLGVLVARQEVFVIGGAAAATALLHWFATRTDLGRTARACADDRRSASAIGIRVERVETAAFVAAMALAALAAVLVTPIQGAAVGTGDVVALKAFLAVSLFGLGNRRGVVPGAMLVALLESFVARYVSSDAKTLVVLGALLVMLTMSGGRAQMSFRRSGRRVAS